jgi:hypothetical protein
MFEAGDAAQRRGLAAAGGPEQDHDLSLAHIEADAVHRRATGGELLAKLFDLQSIGHERA